ncbi:MAG: hypothetical protein QXK77_03270 [Archaeoglobaceae archaeon]
MSYRNNLDNIVIAILLYLIKKRLEKINISNPFTEAQKVEKRGERVERF